MSRKIGWVLLMLGCMAVWHCRTAPTLAQMLDERIRDPLDDTRVMPILFLTNRAVSGATPGCTDAYFTVAPTAEKRFGTCLVNVPRRHAVGALDSSSDSVDPHAHFRINRYMPLAEADYDALLAKDPGDILVFIHGFNVKFQEAVFRAAQIGYDAKFQGSILLYSWPAGAKPGFFASFRMDSTYSENQANARASIPVIKSLIKKLAGTKRRVFVVVHSMGHQVTIPALAALADEGLENRVEELIFTAPDFPLNDFRGLAPKLRKIGRRVTVYCSPGDNALKASERMNGNRRVGQCARVSGVDVINVNSVDSPVLGIGGLGHGYYSSRALLTDLFQLMLGLKVNKRLFVRKAADNAPQDFVLRN